MHLICAITVYIDLENAWLGQLSDIIFCAACRLHQILGCLLLGRDKHFTYANALSKFFPGGTTSRTLDASVKLGVHRNFVIRVYVFSLKGL